MEFVLDRSSQRAQRAHYAKILGRTSFGVTAFIIGLLSLSGGVSLLILGYTAGLLVFLPLAIILPPYFWYRGNLADIATGPYKTPALILLHEALEPDTLAILMRGQNLSAYDIWKSLENSEVHYFLHNRYKLDSDFFEALLDKTPGSSQAVWLAAHALNETYETDGYTNMLLLVALVKSVPSVEQVLRTNSLELSDIETGIDWMGDIRKKRTLLRNKQHFGGIGRDWAYGYTPILRTLGSNLSESIQRHGFFSDTSMHEQVVQQMTQTMGTSSSTITLVGDVGVGKTTCVYAFAETLLTDPTLPKHIRYSQVVQLDATALIANASKPGELEDLMIHIFNEAHGAKNIILFFDEAQAFFGSDTGSVNLANVLQPILESGSIRIIFAMNPQNWQRLASNGLASRLTPITVPATNEADTLAVLRDQVGIYEYRHKITYTYEALQEAYKLGGRYVTTQSMPGAAMQILTQAATTAQQKLITRSIIQQSVEQTYGIKLQTADANESSNLLNLETELKRQVISQDRAISVISNALRRSRSGVSNPDRPIGTFLFLGPTGVGKTELSKALARSYFGNENALIRVDMNQYVAATDVARLIAPSTGNELNLLGEVRKQPFSVILLDEIEKAHPSVINALLQVLDEGIMKDSDNQSVSFRDAILIATSNAGADEIRRLIDEGQDIGQLETTFTDTLIAQGSFAPEFINRFDEVVLFKPLNQEELIHVIDLIIGGINKTLDNQKISVSLTPAAKQWLVARGYNSKLGARPMRRMAQRYVENIIAKRVLEGSLQSGNGVELDVADLEATEN